MKPDIVRLAAYWRPNVKLNYGTWPQYLDTGQGIKVEGDFLFILVSTILPADTDREVARWDVPEFGVRGA